MKGKLAIGVVVLLLVGVAAATVGLFLFPYEPTNPPAVNTSGSTAEGIQNVVDSNNKFAFDIYEEMEDKEGNVFYSPYSISSALAMTYEGARGNTAEEMKSVFYFPESEVLRPNFAAIYTELNSEDKSYELRTGNALWAQKGYHFLDDYFSTVESRYGGKAVNLDFVGENEKSKETINTFIEEQTNGKIKDIISELSINTRLVLTNAIYFKGNWEKQFDKDDTLEKDFYADDGNVKVDMMAQTEDFNYAETDELQILEMDYEDEELSMIVLLPKENYSLGDIEIDYESVENYKSQLVEKEVKVSFPKFEFDAKYQLVETLKKMGMPEAFSGGADFSGMTGSKDLFIAQVIHQAYVKVDEEGTEAAAATVVVMEIMAIDPSRQTVFNADHPFVFLIQEKATGNILFIGKVVNPSE